MTLQPAHAKRTAESLLDDERRNIAKWRQKFRELAAAFERSGLSSEDVVDVSARVLTVGRLERDAKRALERHDFGAAAEIAAAADQLSKPSPRE